MNPENKQCRECRCTAAWDGDWRSMAEADCNVTEGDNAQMPQGLLFALRSLARWLPEEEQSSHAGDSWKHTLQ
ncbi:hypothetical protein FRC12_014004 [Ceratobasidium sp. 428]|nr:hypothetical protein FRC12_014004 [Ceratobasidium sp. 428]